MERGVKGFVQKAVGNITLADWLDKFVCEDAIRGSKSVQTTFGNSKIIPEYQAAYVFSPVKMRGTNGVMLVKYLGIGEIREIMIKMIQQDGFKEPIAWYPMGIPIKHTTAHEEACTMMIGERWTSYKTVVTEKKWALIGTFNVMQFFFYNASLAFQSPQLKKSAENYLTSLKSIVDNVIPELLKQDSKEELKQYIFNSASSLDSDDVLHSCLSLAIVDKYMPGEA